MATSVPTFSHASYRALPPSPAHPVPHLVLQILNAVLSSLSHAEEEIREAASRADGTLRALLQGMPPR